MKINDIRRNAGVAYWNTVYSFGNSKIGTFCERESDQKLSNIIELQTVAKKQMLDSSTKTGCKCTTRIVWWERQVAQTLSIKLDSYGKMLLWLLRSLLTNKPTKYEKNLSSNIITCFEERWPHYKIQNRLIKNHSLKRCFQMPQNFYKKT